MCLGRQEGIPEPSGFTPGPAGQAAPPRSLLTVFSRHWPVRPLAGQQKGPPDTGVQSHIPRVSAWLGCEFCVGFLIVEVFWALLRLGSCLSDLGAETSTYTRDGDWCLATGAPGVRPLQAWQGRLAGPGGSDTLQWYHATTGVQVLPPAMCSAPPPVVLCVLHWLSAFVPILGLCSRNSSRLFQYICTPRMALSWFCENNQKMECCLRQI